MLTSIFCIIYLAFVFQLMIHKLSLLHLSYVFKYFPKFLKCSKIFLYLLWFLIYRYLNHVFSVIASTTACINNFSIIFAMEKILNCILFISLSHFKSSFPGNLKCLLLFSLILCKSFFPCNPLIYFACDKRIQVYSFQIPMIRLCLDIFLS